MREDKFLIFRAGSVEDVVDKYEQALEAGEFSYCFDWQILNDGDRYAPVVLVARVIQGDAYDELEITEALQVKAVEAAA